ncbi:MAG: Spermine synthase [Parcubacteria group bacterium GW2011_GWC1_42_11]|uniref:Spermine synthase n=1 Tax=Candidatus Nomurabacteria bacterium GW2011_GWC2_42_20 TaxID=1618756 RepID=A0A0G0ZI21_9BACT|nr:MAG: Spermine synthase [Parcubacteria group bacterium GW2011_GWC1_42_11]KKS48397.1 MAG: Spermine synthase [Candidatus Nomurabacteria bacterium GW2011_GWC2_42_20]KKT09973.1 MAG: Spermine synthase [Candidatus Nomurabacteria bacterium GW2011_GWB1_43_20]
MNKFFKQNLLLISVFITGACVLIIEVVAVRVLSPHYGNTIFTVSSVISVVLAALSIGYYVGGMFADRHPSMRWFFGIILVSGILLLTVHLLGRVILPIMSINLSITMGPLLSSAVLFFLPALLLGTLSPYAIKLQSVQFPDQGVGDVSGKIFFWSTLGSILGSLLSGFVLIPHFGIDYIFIATGTTLFILGFVPLLIFGLEKKQLFRSLLIISLLVFIAISTVQQKVDASVYSKDGIYEKITIYDGAFNERPTRFFQQDKSPSAAMFIDSNNPTDMVYEYTRYYSVYKLFKLDVQNALVIGAGAYSIPKALLEDLPNATVDVSDIEPSLFILSKGYFGLEENQRLHNHIKDGRRFLRDSDKKYDLIFSDVYHSLFSIPVHFTTQEFFTIAKKKLSADGVFIANVVGDLSMQQPSFLMAEIRTFQSVFPNSYFFAVDATQKTGLQNIIFVGYNGNKKIDLYSDQLLSPFTDKLIRIKEFDLSQSPLLTDNYAPVEYLSAKFLQQALGK